jgi:hypothetical protein
MPNTSSPGAKRVTPRPTSTTVPARSSPGTGLFGAQNPKPMMRIRYGLPVMRCHVPRSSPAACTFTITSPSRGDGRSVVPTRSTSVEP